MPLLPTILADLPFGKPQRDYNALLPLLTGLPVRPTHRSLTRFGDRCPHTHGRQAARACDFAALNLAGLCAVVPHAHELAWAGDSTERIEEGKQEYNGSLFCLLDTDLKLYKVPPTAKVEEP
ncbi:MAG: hypothetical protein OXC13_19890 [Caldilineaceae bacterium]|nr:hypothetical protein [Caldilineaceae bacterium]